MATDTMNGWENVTTCLLCGSDKVSDQRRAAANPILFIHAADEFDLMANTVVNYFQCAVCGLWYQTPRLTEKALSVYYSSGFYRQTNGVSDEASDADEEARAKKLVEFLAGREFKSVFDIGCSRGYFLKFIDIPIKHGVEIDRRRPFQINEKLIYSEIPYDIFSFDKPDLITMVHYLEHESDPLGLLKRLDCRYLYIEVPSEESQGGPARMPHLTIWSLPTLLYMAELLGMKPIKYRHTPHHALLLEKG